MFRRQAQSVGARVGIAVGAAATATLLSAFVPGSRETPYFQLFLLAVLASAWFGGWLGGLLCTALSALTVIYFFSPPSLSFRIDSPADIVRLTIFVAVALLVTGFLAVARERSGMEASLYESQVKFRAIAESTPAAIYICEGTRYIYVNPAAEAISGYSSAELLGKDFFFIVHPDFHEPMRRRWQARQRGEPVVPQLQVKIVRKDGEERWMEFAAVLIEIGGKPLLLGTAFDITERQRAEADRDRLFDFSMDPLCIVGLDGYFRRVNPAWTKILGWSETELLTRPWFDFIHPDDQGAALQAAATFAEGRPLHGFEIRYLHKDGSSRWFSWNAIVLPDAGLGVAVGRDTTEAKRAEADLHRLAGELLRAQDDERRRLARELHDSFGQNVAAISLSLGRVAESSTALDEPARRALNDCRETIDQCAQQVRSLSHLLHPPLLEELGLAAAIRAFTRGFSERSGIAVEAALDEDIGPLAPDAALALFRVVQASLSNVQVHSGSPTASVTLRREASAVTLEIADRGRGLPVGAHDAEASLGVGILGMRERLRQLGGHLDITSAGGVTVRAIVPLKEESR
jgi:PAS domain S-box-containing protein